MFFPRSLVYKVPWIKYPSPNPRAYSPNMPNSTRSLGFLGMGLPSSIKAQSGFTQAGFTNFDSTLNSPLGVSNIHLRVPEGSIRRLPLPAETVALREVWVPSFR